MLNPKFLYSYLGKNEFAIFKIISLNERTMMGKTFCIGIIRCSFEYVKEITR